MEKTTYTVTELAGPKVAGQRVNVGDDIELTETQALGETLAGTIVKKGVKRPPAPLRPETAKTRRIQQNANGDLPPVVDLAADNAAAADVAPAAGAAPASAGVAPAGPADTDSGSRT